MTILKNRTIALIYRIFSAAVIFIALLLEFGVFEEKIQYRLFIYFTFQSNIWCLIFFIFLIYETIIDLKTKGKVGYSTVSPLIRGEVMLCIILTHLVYHFILAPRRFKMIPSYRNSTFYMIQNVLLHYVTPYLTILDYLLFSEKNIFGIFHPFAWLLLPIVYIIDVFVVAHYITVIPTKNSRYPYFFFDVDLLGVEKVVKYNICLGIGLIVFAYFIVFLDWLLGIVFKSTKNKEKEN